MQFLFYFFMIKCIYPMLDNLFDWHHFGINGCKNVFLMGYGLKMHKDRDEGPKMNLNVSLASPISHSSHAQGGIKLIFQNMPGIWDDINEHFAQNQEMEFVENDHECFSIRLNLCSCAFFDQNFDPLKQICWWDQNFVLKLEICWNVVSMTDIFGCVLVPLIFLKHVAQHPKKTKIFQCQ